ncbi:MAG: hypothetical protein KC468_37815, partial [Myxococcales bacterium]|nr:hypothetical protein [Myxococcales bacterium]
RAALDKFDAGDGAAGEEIWAEVMTALPSVAAAQREASQAIEAALSLDSARALSRDALGDVLYERAL